MQFVSLLDSHDLSQHTVVMPVPQQNVCHHNLQALSSTVMYDSVCYHVVLGIDTV